MALPSTRFEDMATRQPRVGARLPPTLGTRDDSISEQLSLANMPLLNPEPTHPVKRRPSIEEDRSGRPPSVGHTDELQHPVHTRVPHGQGDVADYQHPFRSRVPHGQGDDFDHQHPLRSRVPQSQGDVVDFQHPVHAGNGQVYDRMVKQPIIPGMRRGTQRPIFSISDDRVMLQQVLETHSPDMLGIDVEGLLPVIRNIFNTPIPNVDSSEIPSQAEFNSKNYGERSQFEMLTDLIDMISAEIDCHCTRRGLDLPAMGLSDGRNAVTYNVLRLVSKYRWDAKIVLVLAALAVKYGVFLLIAQTYATNELTKSMTLIKQLPGFLVQPAEKKPRLDKLRALMDEMVNLTMTMIEIFKIPDEYISQRFIDHIPVPVYWIVKYAIVSASQITSSFEHDHLSSFTEMSEINMGIERMRKMNEHLRNLLHTCRLEIARITEDEEYQYLIRIMEEFIHVDATVPLSRLFKPIDYLYHGLGEEKPKVSIDVLRRKSVLLLISDLDNFNEALYMLENMYNEVRYEGSFELVWLPVLGHSVEWSEREMTKFEQLHTTMRWHVYPEPWLLNRPTIRYVKERWNFKSKPILVAMDPHGKVVCKNAFPMVWIWQQSMSLAFTTSERDLWRDQTWSIDFLVDGTDPTAFNWIQDDRYVCIYGGEDMEWIMKFTTAVKKMGVISGIPVEMMYVGKRYPKERVQRIIERIQREKLSHSIADTVQAWYFWDRIETMWESIHHVMKEHPEERNDKMLQEIVTILGYGGEHGGWALISRISEDMVRAKGDVFYTCVDEVDQWKDKIPERGFLGALKDHLSLRHPPHHCLKFLLPAAAGVVPEQVKCSECGRIMDKSLLYSCCVD